MRALISSVFVVGAISGAALGLTIYNAQRSELVPAPIVINVPPGPPPAITVTVPEPAAAVPDESISVPASMADDAGPLATSPQLWAQCVAIAWEEAAPPECAWHAGFPAISRDGSRIAIKYNPDDSGERGYPGLVISLLDTATGKVVRTIEILDPNDYIEPGPEQEAAAVKQAKLIRARIKHAQQLLDAGGYRSLSKLGEYDEYAHERDDDDDGVIDQPRVTREGVYAEIAGSGAVRIVDAAKGTTLFQRDFTLPNPRANKPDEECSGWAMHAMSVWWDPATRIVLADQIYRTGGCMCGDTPVQQVARAPA